MFHTTPGGDRPATPDRTGSFEAGTLIVTAQGERPVETLASGDRIMTRDAGLQRLRWVGPAGALPEGALRIAPGALGRGLPDRALVLAHGHRVLLRGEAEALVAVGALPDRPGIAPAASGGARYLMRFDRGEIVMANGSWVECGEADGPDRPHRARTASEAERLN